MARPQRVIKKKEKRNIPTGIAHVNSTFNNTIITFTDPTGNVISWASSGALPAWLEIDAPALKGSVKALPTREDITFPMTEQLIVELYSK